MTKTSFCNVSEKEAARKEIKADIQAFLESGGKIDVRRMEENQGGKIIKTRKQLAKDFVKKRNKKVTKND